MNLSEQATVSIIGRLKLIYSIFKQNHKCWMWIMQDALPLGREGSEHIDHPQN